MEEKDREIARILAGKEISWRDLTENKRNLARRVYDTAVPRLKKLSELKKRIDEYKFNKQTLADELHINRKTLGSNNPEIAILIETLVKKSQPYNHTSKSSSTFRAEIAALKKRIDSLAERDCELIMKDEECRKLQKDIELRKRQYDDLKKKYDELKEKYEKTQLDMSDQMMRFKVKNNSTS